MLHWIATRRTFDNRTLFWSQVNGQWLWLPHRRHAVLYKTREAAEMRIADYRGEVVEVMVLDTRRKRRKGSDPPTVVEPQGSAVVDEVGVFEQKALWTAEGLFV